MNTREAPRSRVNRELEPPDPEVYLSFSEGRYRVIQHGVPISADKATAEEALQVARQFGLTVSNKMWNGDIGQWAPLWRAGPATQPPPPPGRRGRHLKTRARPATRRSTARFAMTEEAVMKLASELSRETNGSPPKPIPGGYRWSEQNESAQFTTYSPEYHQKVVVVVSIFADGSAAVDFFGDEGTSETARYENVGHFTYSSRTDLPEMVKDIDWVWKTVDGYAASWQEDDGGEVDEARGPWKWTVKGSHSGKVLHANGYDITSSQKEWKRWNPVPPFAVWRGQELVGGGFTTLEDAKRAARQADEGGEVDEARRPADDAP